MTRESPPNPMVGKLAVFPIDGIKSRLQIYELHQIYMNIDGTFIKEIFFYCYKIHANKWHRKPYFGIVFMIVIQQILNRFTGICRGAFCVCRY